MIQYQNGFELAAIVVALLATTKHSPRRWRRLSAAIEHLEVVGFDGVEPDFTILPAEPILPRRLRLRPH